jgi:endoglucanase
VFVRVNQIGFRPADSKTAIALARAPLPSAFSVVDAGNGRVVFHGVARPAAGSWGEFTTHAELDFSAFQRQGRYRVAIAGASSPAFEIRPRADARVVDRLLEFLRQQRCGRNVWLGAMCHQHDGRSAYGPMPPGTAIDATGGWHDAGDQLKYLLTSSDATAQLLLAAVLGSRSPHLIDEARWGIDWMLKLHPSPDQLYHQVADDRDHVGWRLPQDDRADYGWGPGNARVVYFADGRPQGLREFKSASTGVANLAGRYAAAMALGVQVWHDERLLQAAREVYALGRAKEGVQQGNSYGAPYRYEETTWADDMEWGAAELFRVTRERRYLDDAVRYAGLAASDSWMGRERTGHYQYYPFVNIGHFRLFDLVDAATQRRLAQYYAEGIERCRRAAAANPYGVGVPFIWCSNNLVVALATQCLLYERMTGRTRDRAFASRQRDWLLGRNPWGVSMITGVPDGGVYPHAPHLFATALLGRAVPGGLVDGPVARAVFASLKGVSIAEPDPLARFQDDRAVYHDDLNDYATNEPTMDGTASAILLFAIASSR